MNCSRLIRAGAIASASLVICGVGATTASAGLTIYRNGVYLGASNRDYDVTRTNLNTSVEWLTQNPNSTAYAGAHAPGDTSLYAGYWATGQGFACGHFGGLNLGAMLKNGENYSMKVTGYDYYGSDDAC